MCEKCKMTFDGLMDFPVAKECCWCCATELHFDQVRTSRGDRFSVRIHHLVAVCRLQEEEKKLEFGSRLGFQNRSASV